MDQTEKKMVIREKRAELNDSFDAVDDEYSSRSKNFDVNIEIGILKMLSKSDDEFFFQQRFRLGSKSVTGLN